MARRVQPVLLADASIPLPREAAKTFKQQWTAGLVRPEARVNPQGDTLELALLNEVDQSKRIAKDNAFMTDRERKIEEEAAEVDIANRSGYRKIAGNGKPLLFSATDWDCVQQVKTGLIWQAKTASEKYKWDDANNKYPREVNEQKLCGYANWRLPTKDELLGIVDKGQRPAISKVYFPNTPSSDVWSSSPYNSGSAWYVYFDDGIAYSNYNRYAVLHVRLVRGGQ